MSLLFGGLGTIILYLSFAGDPFALSSYAVVVLGAAAVIIRILPE